MSFNHILHYETGELKTEMNIIDGKVDGVVNNYWKNGNLQYVTPHTDGRAHGDAIKYAEDGEVLQTTTYDAGAVTHIDGEPYTPEEPELEPPEEII